MVDGVDFVDAPDVWIMKDLSLKRKLLDEQELLGFTLSADSLEFFDTSGCVAARELHKYRGRRVAVAGRLIAGKLVTTKGDKPRPMKFLSMEDLTGTFEVTLFPDAYQEFALLTTEAGPFLIRGRVEDDLGALSVVADHIERLKDR